jgi:hypothetical protein
MEPKAGFRTTEFWLSAVATVVGLVMASGVLPEQTDNLWVRLVGGVVAMLAALGYTASRAKVKSGG